MESTRKKIIFVDDINYSLLTVKDRLKGNYEVFLAQSSAKLFEILDNVKADLIMLDVNMPQFNGYEILALLKADKDFADIPVIFLTSQNDKASVTRAMALGAVDYFLKPFVDSKLIECIENHLDPEKREEYRPKILAVDDNPSILKAVYYILSSQYKVYTLNEPEKLSEFLENVHPNLFILDYKMPGLSGFDLVPIIRDIPMHSNTPIIFLTSEGTADKILDARCLGASGYIVKPINENVLREKIAYHIVDHLLWRRIRVR